MNELVWEIGQPISAIVDPTAFRANGIAPIDAGTIAGTQVTFHYLAAVIGLPWTFGASSAITLTSGDVVCPGQSGIID